jgi:carbon storage regulator
VLVLSRKVGQRILIGDKISVTVVKLGNGGVRIGVEAPAEMAIVREELAAAMDEADRQLATQTAESPRPR